MLASQLDFQAAAVAPGQRGSDRLVVEIRRAVLGGDEAMRVIGFVVSPQQLDRQCTGQSARDVELRSAARVVQPGDAVISSFSQRPLTAIVVRLR